MSTQQIASSFVVEFFERFAKNPERLAEFYGQPSVVTFSDFELGIDQVYEKDVGPRMFQYASALQGSQLRVDAMTAATLCNGVDIFVTLSAVSQVKEEFFHITTTLESYPNAYDAQSFFIRHQVIARIGESNAPVQQQQQEIPVEARAPVEEPAQAPVEVEEKPVEVPEVAPAVSNTRTPEPERVEQPEPVTAPAEPEKEATPVKATNAQPKSWLDLASAAKGSTITVKSAARVVVGGEAPPAAAAAPAAAHPKEAAAAPAPKKERKANTPLGDRVVLMIDETVTDDEVKKALGDLCSSIVSLRNNSSKGNVFIDFAEGVVAFDELKKNPPVIGKNGAKPSVQRQRERERK